MASNDHLDAEEDMEEGEEEEEEAQLRRCWSGVMPCYRDWRILKT